MDDSRARKASDLLSAILTPELADKAGSWSKFFGSWKQVAGENLAAHSRPVDLRNGVVFVEAEHPGWIQLLQMSQDSLLARLKRSFPELSITGIAFRLAKDGSLPGLARSPTKKSDAEPGEGQSLDERGQSSGDARPTTGSEGQSFKKNLEETIEAVEDEGFRGILASLAKTLEDQAQEKATAKRRPRDG